MKYHTLHDLPKQDRPRERLQSVGVSNLSIQELLALIIEKGRTNQNVMHIAQNLLSTFGSMSNIQNATLSQLRDIPRIGTATACKLQAAFELGKRIQYKLERNREKIISPEDVYNRTQDIADKKREHFILLCLNSRNHLIVKENISLGTVNASIAHPREIFKIAIVHSAISIILVHNHPSGNPSPSDYDIQITKSIQKAGELLKIPLLDHIIVTQNRYKSIMHDAIKTY